MGPTLPPSPSQPLATSCHHLAMCTLCRGGFRSLLRREVLLPLLALLVLTAPRASPAYCASLLLVNHVVTMPAHLAFRHYQQEAQGGPPPTVVNSLLFLLSLLVHMGEANALVVLLLRLLAEEVSRGWYQDHPGLACLLIFPRWGLYTSKRFIRKKCTVHCPVSGLNFRDITRNVEENEIIH